MNWDEIEKSGGGEYKDYAPAGIYKLKVAKVDIHEISTGSVAEDFIFAEDDYKYPKATHWLSFNNDNWRCLHQRNLMMLLGVTKEAAQKAVEICESKNGKDAKISAYQQTYDKLLKKNPEVEIEVWKEDGAKYSDADFTHGSVRMDKPGGSTSKKDKKKDEGQIILDQAEPVEMDMGDLPF